MASFHIVYDENDPELGIYFQACKQDLVEFISNNLAGARVVELGASYNLDDLDNYLRSVNTDNFVFVAYSHGDDSSLYRKGLSYISVNTNSTLFPNSFFYSVSCSSASELGPAIIEGGGLTFIGYRRPFLIPLQNQGTSVNCANRGIQMFILGKRADEAFESMKAFYTVQSDRLLQFGDVVAASLLTATREALMFLGNPAMAIGDFP
jgi:hypothetical protein